MQVFGHRGAAGHATENTLTSLRTALALQVDGIEIDVRVTQDEVPVLLHDETLDRTTPASGMLSELTWTEVRQAFPDADLVPSLAEAIAVVGTRTLINIELKELAAAEPTCRILRDATASGMIEATQVIVSSFVHDAVELTVRLAPEFPVALLTKGLPPANFWHRSRAIGAVAANVDVESVDEGFVTYAQREGLRVMVYTVNTPTEAQRMRTMGVDALFSDYPDRVRVVT